VTPVRDELANLRRLSECLLGQELSPRVWVIVENGSTDGTSELARELAANTHWVQAVAVPGAARAIPGAPIVRAFHAGIAALGQSVDVVVKLDADVSFGGDYFSRLVQAFADDPHLAIASGTCFELEDGLWRETHATGNAVRGASRAYREDFLREILPLPERMGWDGADELMAHGRGWTTRTLRDLQFRHHRSVGERDGSRGRRWRAQGNGAYFMGYRPSYLLLRALHHARSDPMALEMCVGYAGAALRRDPRLDDPSARAYLRRQQRLRNVFRRFREATGSRPAPTS
jgi:poly-beta-1,6-N-acetyl-D-glucosamine synthase